MLNYHDAVVFMSIRKFNCLDTAEHSFIKRNTFPDQRDADFDGLIWARCLIVHHIAPLAQAPTAISLFSVEIQLAKRSTPRLYHTIYQVLRA